MSNFQNPITTTRLPKENLPIFEFEDALHMGSPNPSPNKPNSMKCEPTSSHPGWDIVMPRLGTQASRSPTPEIDQVHPRQIQRRDPLLDTKPGFFRSDNSYISHWECCKVQNFSLLNLAYEVEYVEHKLIINSVSAKPSTKSLTKTKLG